MTNQPDRLVALLDLADANTQLVITAAEERPELPERNEVWWPSLIQCFGGENVLFERFHLDRCVFSLAYVFVREVPLEQRGKRGL